jgi:hypothetical protein
MFPDFTRLPDEIIDNQVDDVAITKIAKRGPWQPETQSIPGVAHFNFLSSLETSTWRGPAWSWNLSQGSFDLTIQRDEQNLQKQKTCNSAKKQAVLRETPAALWRQTVDSRLLTMKCPYCWCGDEWKRVCKSIAVVWHATKTMSSDIGNYLKR